MADGKIVGPEGVWVRLSAEEHARAFPKGPTRSGDRTFKVTETFRAPKPAPVVLFFDPPYQFARSPWRSPNAEVERFRQEYLGEFRDGTAHEPRRPPRQFMPIDYSSLEMRAMSRFTQERVAADRRGEDVPITRDPLRFTPIRAPRHLRFQVRSDHELPGERAAVDAAFTLSTGDVLRMVSLKKRSGTSGTPFQLDPKLREELFEASGALESKPQTEIRPEAPKRKSVWDWIADDSTED